jgi:NADH-quinone oxidoreductase subunit M
MFNASNQPATGRQYDWITVAGWNIQYHLGIDGLSILLVLLTAFLTPISILSTWSAMEERVKDFMIFFLLLEVGMMGVFLAQDLFLFYIFWEFTLVPMYFLIGIWGGPRRIYAAIKFFLYTMAGSILMLLAILWLGIEGGTFSVPDLIAQGNIPPIFSGGCSLLLLRHLRSRFRCGPCIRGCPMHTSKRPPPVPSSWRVSC